MLWLQKVAEKIWMCFYVLQTVNRKCPELLSNWEFSVTFTESCRCLASSESKTTYILVTNETGTNV